MLIRDPWTKKVRHKNVEIDWCKNLVINPKVKFLYYKYKDECDQYLLLTAKQYLSKKDYYVYAWFTKKEPKRYFYVGKGKKGRYRHIKSDIRKYETGKSTNIRFKQYGIIEKENGIDYEILLDNLSEYEALIYEQCMKIKMIHDDEVLLNVEGIPKALLPDGWRITEYTDYPCIEDNRFYRRYVYKTAPYFDPINIRKLNKLYIYCGILYENNNYKKVFFRN